MSLSFKKDTVLGKVPNSFYSHLSQDILPDYALVDGDDAVERFIELYTDQAKRYPGRSRYKTYLEWIDENREPLAKYLQNYVDDPTYDSRK